MKHSGDTALAFLQKPDPAIRAVLVFCEDEGVASDGAHDLIAAWAGQQEVDVHRLHEEDVGRNPADFFDALEARPLLGGLPVLRLRLSGEKIARTLIDAVAFTESAPDRMAAGLIVTAGNLRKSSKLRQAFESGKHSAALQLLADDETDMAALVRDTLASDGIEIAPEALDLCIGGLPGHRRLAHAEIEKLALYGLGLNRPIAPDDVRALSAGDVDHALDQLVSAMFAGDAAFALAQLERVTLSGQTPISILRAIQREGQRMITAHALGGADGRDIGAKLRPPIFGPAWAAFARRLNQWPPMKLSRLLERVHDCEYDAKQSGPIADALLKRLVSDITRQASTRRSPATRNR